MRRQSHLLCDGPFMALTTLRYQRAHVEHIRDAHIRARRAELAAHAQVALLDLAVFERLLLEAWGVAPSSAAPTFTRIP